MGKRHRHSTPQRSRQIADVLARHGLGYLVGVFSLERVIPFQRGLLKHPRRATPYTQPEHLRMAFEELGTTFIKLGQILSTRSDIIGLAMLLASYRLSSVNQGTNFLIEFIIVGALGVSLAWSIFRSRHH